MQKRRKLSVIAVFHNQRDDIESTLGAVYNLQNTDYELFIINDGSDDDSSDIVHSLLDYHQHDETYYFEHPEKLGRGRSINEALENISGGYVWIINALESIDEPALQDAISGLDEYQSLCAIQDPFFDNFDVIQWIPGIREQRIPNDQLFLWNWKALNTFEQFCNPFIDVFTGFELATRILHQNNFNEIVPFFTPLESGNTDISLEEINELLFGLARRTIRNGMSVKALLEYFEQINNEAGLNVKGHEMQPVVTKMNFGSLFAEAGVLHQDGSNSESLQIVNRLLEFDSQNIEVQRLKASLLERMKRYVEAAEIKQQLKHREKESRQSLGEEENQELQESELIEKEEDIREYEEPEHITTSIIIPTASDRKPVLEECLVALGEFCSPRRYGINPDR